MSNKSNDQGRAYEYAFLTTLYDAIKKFRAATIQQNSSYKAALKAWNTLTNAQQNLYKISAYATISTFFSLEPNIIEPTDDKMQLYIQPDKKGEEGDVRDVIVERKDVTWSIGMSMKHNHEAVKHSRLSESLDFGEKWYNVPCSQDYWNDVKPVFDYLEQCKKKVLYFRDIPQKEDNVYVPLLKAFMREIKKQVEKNSSIPRRLVEYLLSKYDFYKVISNDNSQITTIQSFNMHGTLNKPSKATKPGITIPVTKLPSSLMDIKFKQGSKTTVLMCLDNGWQFSFRLHNAKDLVETSLKFDIQIIGVPTILNTKFICKWTII